MELGESSSCGAADTRKSFIVPLIRSRPLTNTHERDELCCFDRCDMLRHVVIRYMLRSPLFFHVKEDGFLPGQGTNRMVAKGCWFQPQEDRTLPCPQSHCKKRTCMNHHEPTWPCSFIYCTVSNNLGSWLRTYHRTYAHFVPTKPTSPTVHALGIDRASTDAGGQGWRAPAAGLGEDPEGPDIVSRHR